MNYLIKLKEKLKQGLVVPVVGAGVSYATCEMPGWKGLIEDGLKYAVSLGANSDEIIRANAFLEKNKLIEAATIVKRLLNAPGHPFTNWLNDNFEKPTIKSTELIKSIQNLCQPIIATTNYDDLLRTVGSVQTDMALDWSQHEEIQSCLSQNKRFILHLHGLFTRPKTPIFGADDYENLSKQKGYKIILNQLWMQRSFLFIGCSRDGVMDEDFRTVLKLMKEWFPGQQNEHYILMQEKEKGSQIHLELLQECNVHLVPFGKNHSELPKFINKLNPNAQEIVNRYNQQKIIAFEGIKSILEAQPESNLEENVKDFVKETLGLPYYWLSNDKINIFLEALENYNSTIKEKQNIFVNLQTIMHAIIDPSDLKSKIDLWFDNPDDTSLLNNLEFINMGILAWELLGKFPSDVINDIKLRHPNAIHPYYFTGHLKKFYNEAKEWKESSGSANIFDGDTYFFENLRRIMNSLLGILELEVSELYSEKPEAIITEELPEEFLLTVFPHKLVIADIEKITDIIAELPWDENLEFGNALVTDIDGKKIVIGFNDQYCFTWNPVEEITSTNFFQAKPNEYINNINVQSQNNHILIDIFTNKRKVIIVNFSESTDVIYEEDYKDYVKISSSKTYCAATRLGRLFKGPCVFEFSALGDYHPMITAVKLWEILKAIPEIGTEYDNYLKEETISFDNEDIMYPYIEDITLSKIAWLRGTVLAMRIRFGFTGAASTAIILIDPLIGFDKPLLKIYFPHKNCFCFDTHSYKNNVDLLIGYLDHNQVGNLIQYFQNIQESEYIVAYNQPGLIPQDLINREKIKDMFFVNFVSEKRAFVIEEGKVLHDIDIKSLISTKTTFGDGIKSVRFFNK